MHIARKALKLLVGLLVGGLAWLWWSGTASAQNVIDPGCEVTNVSFSNGTSTSPTLGGLGAVRGQHITVTFTVPDGCQDQLTLASYRAPGTSFDASKAGQQVLFSSQTSTFGPGSHTLAIDVFGTAAAGDPSDCSVQHDNSNGGGANQSPGPYDDTCDGSASQNGASTDNNSSKPCAGCVGNADDKNPPGQYPDGSDHNAGYECDRNQGVGQTNPAHTGCQAVQIDFAYGAVITHLGNGPGGGGFYNDTGTDTFRLIDFRNG